MHMCVHACVCADKHTYVYYAFVYICLCLCMCMFVYMHTYIVYMCKYMHVYICMYMCVCVCMCICMCIHVCMHVCVHVYVVRHLGLIFTALWIHSAACSHPGLCAVHQTLEIILWNKILVLSSAASAGSTFTTPSTCQLPVCSEPNFMVVFWDSFMYPRLVLNSQYSWRWPWAPNLPACLFPGLGLKVCTTTLALN